MARVVQDEDWRTFALRAWADADYDTLTIALQEPGANLNAVFSTYGGWGLIEGGKVYFDDVTSPGWVS